MNTPRIEHPGYFSDSIFSLSKIRPCSIASDIVLNFLLSNEDPVFSFNHVRIFGCNVMESLSRFTSFNNFGMITYETAKKLINILNNITYKNTQNLTKEVNILSYRIGSGWTETSY